MKRAPAIAFVLLLSLAFAISYAFNFRLIPSIKDHFGYLAGFAYGLHLSYAYMFNREMFARGVSSPNNEGQIALRKFYGWFGGFVLVMLFYGVWFWHGHT